MSVDYKSMIKENIYETILFSRNVQERFTFKEKKSLIKSILVFHNSNVESECDFDGVISPVIFGYR